MPAAADAKTNMLRAKFSVGELASSPSDNSARRSNWPICRKLTFATLAIARASNIDAALSISALN